MKREEKIFSFLLDRYYHHRTANAEQKIRDYPNVRIIPGIFYGEENLFVLIEETLD